MVAWFYFTVVFLVKVVLFTFIRFLQQFAGEQ